MLDERECFQPGSLTDIILYAHEFALRGGSARLNGDREFSLLELYTPKFGVSFTCRDGEGDLEVLFICRAGDRERVESFTCRFGDRYR